MPLIKSGLPCPSCGSSDATALYTDGSYCFSCKKYTPTLVFSSIHNEGISSSQSYKSSSSCTQTALPVRAIKYLKKYGLTDEEIHDSKILWDESQARLAYPVENSTCVVGFEKRSITGRKPKTIFTGSKVNSFHLIKPEKEEFPGVIAVEDIISAIKVGRVANTLCLFGSQVSTRQYHEISLITNLFTLWLDLDKFDQATKIARRAQSFGLQTRVIKTDLDPKMYSTNEIRKIINET